MTVGPVIALSHGGGPMPILGDKNHDSIVYSLKNRVPKILKLGTPEQPRAIILVTAHWSTEQPTISSAASHNLLYDYYGFPEEAYSLKYPAPGSPEIAQEVNDLLEKAGFQPILDSTRGWDHGVFVPLSLVALKADIPIIQLSVLASEDPEAHLRMGRAISQLRASNVAIVGSGFASFHNLGIMRQLMMSDQFQRATFKGVSQTWNDALTEGLLSEEEEGKDGRWKTLQGWRKLPHADTMHPPRGGEHFMPLIVCAGAAGDEEKTRRYKDEFVGVEINTYYWGGEEIMDTDVRTR